jgi:beta-fructofuranosidase
MYSSRGFRDWEIGDIDVVREGDFYHLFHLIIPNHDYIAHAISRDGIAWSRVKNALFVGEPGDWDDDMLWTMNVVRRRGRWAMFYAGLSRRDAGRIQRIGLAESDDLYTWTKTNDRSYPLESAGPWYEAHDANPRTWISFRDPFLFLHDGKEYLTFCGRVREGATFRRGCAGVLRLDDGAAELLAPLHWPRVYDDVECPCVFKLGRFWFLVGSIREDVQVRYWYSANPLGPYQAPSENVLFPKGNYATRVTYDGDTMLLYSFFILGRDVTGTRVLPPPTQVGSSGGGRLFLTTYYRWDTLVTGRVDLRGLGDPSPILANPTAHWSWLADGAMRMGSVSGYEFFLWKAPVPQFRWKLEVGIERVGKLGLIVNADETGQGNFLVLDAINGYAQIRSWSEDTTDVFQDYRFQNLQANHFHVELPMRIEFLVYGDYLELSISGRIVLSLMNSDHRGDRFGVFSSSAEFVVSGSTMDLLEAPATEYTGGGLEIPPGGPENQS